MPELPEVETTRQGLLPFTDHARVKNLIVRNGNLRWPVDQELENILNKKHIHSLKRRGKYLLFRFEHGTLIWHLGMSGSIRVITQTQAPLKKHDHIDLELSNNSILRFNDPRRFGAVLWTYDPIEQHPLLANLGPEPLLDTFNQDYLYQASRKKTQPIKAWIMDSKTVVGVGNIYASESLFLSGIHPLKPAGKLTKSKAAQLCTTIKSVLANAIKQGGTTLRDFVNAEGNPGYFKQTLKVYGRGGQPCITCGKPLTEKVIRQRNTVYCIQCQK